VEEYQQNKIKKHELTRADKEEDRTRHIDTLSANTGPVFLLYKVKAEINALISRALEKKPVYHFTTPDEVEHIFYVIDDRAIISGIERAFESVPELYVADGHHRSASASRVRELRKQHNPNHTGKEEYNFFLSVIFPDNELQILPYNRVVKDLNNLSTAEFMSKVQGQFDLKPVTKMELKVPHQFSMYLEGQWYHMIPKGLDLGTADPIARLDVSILQQKLLHPILGIGDPRKDKRIDFVGGIRGLGELEKRVDSGESKVAFALYPTTISDLIAIADANQIMPPKSTWFEPKLRSGLVLHLL
jgi:uncharacterized protein (DUF1015 family)